MNTTRIVAAAFAACTTFTVLSAVLSIAEPQRSGLQAMRQAPDAIQSMQPAEAMRGGEQAGAGPGIWAGV
jgi:hypothetical protein